jgi:hypothetical protein
MTLDRQVRQEAGQVGLGHFTGMPVAGGFDDAAIQTKRHLARKEALGSATLWQCDVHGEQFQANQTTFWKIVGHRMVFKRVEVSRCGDKPC